MADDLVAVANFQFLAEAEAARMYLAQEGIRAFLLDSETVNNDWFLGNAVGYIKLAVSTTDAFAARAALDRKGSLRGVASDQEDADVDTCLACGKEMSPKQRRCPDCGWSYSGGGEDIEAGNQVERGPHAAEGPETRTAFATLRSWRILFFLLLLSPMIAVVLVMIGVLVAIVFYAVSDLIPHGRVR